MGSTSDWETLKSAAEMLTRLGVPHETRVVSAHRTPDLLFEYAASARGRGLEVLIAGAGGAAHLPGMTAAKTSLPVLGVPVQSKTLSGLDSLLSIVQMPAGIPVGNACRSAWPARPTPRCSRPRSSVTRTLRSARRSTPSARSRHARCSRSPTPASHPRTHEDRHHRCRPARADAGARRLPAGAALPVPRLERGFARRPGRPDDHRRVRRPGEPRASRRRDRPRHLRIRERARRRACGGCEVAAVPSSGRGAARLAGPAAREGAVRPPRHSDAGLSRRGQPRGPARRRRRDRAARASSRRDGSATTGAASTTCAGLRTSRRPGRRSAACR